MFRLISTTNLIRSFFYVTFLCLLPFISHAQTGPGGVGNATGVNSQPINVLWLRSDAGITTSGSLVDVWADQSGKGNNASVENTAGISWTNGKEGQAISLVNNISLETLTCALAAYGVG